jgi:hypothetical protein
MRKVHCQISVRDAVADNPPLCYGVTLYLSRFVKPGKNEGNIKAATFRAQNFYSVINKKEKNKDLLIILFSFRLARLF